MPNPIPNLQPRTTNVALKFNGKIYSHWQRVSIRSSVDDLCASVQLSITLPNTDEDLPIAANTIIEVLINDTVVSTVRVDSYRRRVTEKSHDISIVARSLGREFVDCKASKTLSGLKLSEIIQKLGEEFKVPVTINAQTALVPDFAMQCENPSNALLNAVRAANLLLYATPDGGILLAEPSDNLPVTTLTYGQRIKNYELVDEYKLRFSEYWVKGYNHESNSANKGIATDDDVGFYRPMHIIADKSGQGLGGSERRAELEKNRRAARAHRIELDVSGWAYWDEHKKPHVWQVNTQIRVQIPTENIDAVFLIGEVDLKLDDKSGHVAHLQIMDRAAFIGEKVKKRGRKKKKGSTNDTTDLSEFKPN